MRKRKIHGRKTGRRECSVADNVRRKPVDPIDATLGVSAVHVRKIRPHPDDELQLLNKFDVAAEGSHPDGKRRKHKKIDARRDGLVLIHLSLLMPTRFIHASRIGLRTGRGA